VTGRNSEIGQTIEVLSLPDILLARGTLSSFTLPDAANKLTVAGVRSDDVTGADRNLQPVQGDICS
jgi:hypothetical protein